MSAEARIFLILIHIFSNSEPTPTPNSYLNVSHDNIWALITPPEMGVLRAALIKAGVGGAGVIRVILKREYRVLEKLSFLAYTLYL